MKSNISTSTTETAEMLRCLLRVSLLGWSKPCTGSIKLNQLRCPKYRNERSSRLISQYKTSRLVFVGFLRVLSLYSVDLRELQPAKGSRRARALRAPGGSRARSAPGTGRVAQSLTRARPGGAPGHRDALHGVRTCVAATERLLPCYPGPAAVVCSARRRSPGTRPR